MKKLTKLTLLGLASVSILTACTQNTTTTSTSTTTSSSTSTTTSETKNNETVTTEVKKISDTSYEAYTEIIIDASPETVWSVLTDFSNMSSWSSSLQTIEGTFKDGEEVDVINGTGDAQMTYHHVIDITEGKSFHWSDPINGMDWLTDDHYYIVEEYGDGQTKFIQKDTFTENRELSEGELSAQELANMAVQGYATFDEELKAQIGK